MSFSFLAFQKPGCPHCGEVSNLLSQYQIPGSFINGETPYGSMKAKHYNVRDLPTVVFHDQGLPICCNSVADVKRFLSLNDIPLKV